MKTGTPLGLRVERRPLDALPSGGKIFENLIDRKDLAELMGLSPSYVSKLMADEGLPYLKIGRSVRYEWSEVKSWLSKRKRP